MFRKGDLAFKMQFLLSKYKKAANSNEFPSIVSCLQQRNLHNLFKTRIRIFSKQGYLSMRQRCGPVIRVLDL